MDLNTGEYVDGEEFLVTEEFWSRDYKELGSAAGLASGMGWLYANGHTPGRISVMVLSKMFQRLLAQLRSLPDSEFRPPRSLSEVETLVKVQMQVIVLLYGLASYSASPIGGEAQTLSIPNPDSCEQAGSGLASRSSAV
jgi:hypothetical protein